MTTETKPLTARSSPPTVQQAANRLVTNLFSEFIPHVAKEYELLTEANAGNSLKISLFDLQMETLIFGFHCLDRALFAFWGATDRAVFMDHAFGAACELLESAMPANEQKRFTERFKEHCHARNREYAGMRALPSEDGPHTGELIWEYAMRTCREAGVDDTMARYVMLNQATTIFTMMLRIAQDL